MLGWLRIPVFPPCLNLKGSLILSSMFLFCFLNSLLFPMAVMRSDAPCQVVSRTWTQIRFSSWKALSLSNVCTWFSSWRTKAHPWLWNIIHATLLVLPGTVRRETWRQAVPRIVLLKISRLTWSSVSFPSHVLPLNLYQMVMSIHSHPAQGWLLRVLRQLCSSGSVTTLLKKSITPSCLSSPPCATLQVPHDPEWLNFSCAQLRHLVMCKAWE